MGTAILELEEVSPHFIKLLGLWDQSVFERVYACKIPFEALRVAAGFKKEKGSYYIPRAHLKPPQALIDKVFPNLTRAKKKLDAMPDCDLKRYATRFCKTMDYFATVLIQDSCYFMTHGRANHRKHIKKLRMTVALYHLRGHLRRL